MKSPGSRPFFFGILLLQNTLSTNVCQLLSHVQFCNPMDCSPPDSSVHGISQARKLVIVLFRFLISSLFSLGSVQYSSVTQSCPTLCGPMNCSTPGLTVHHQLPEFTQTHVHRVGDAIQPSHPLSSPFPPVPNPSQHQSLFQ